MSYKQDFSKKQIELIKKKNEEFNNNEPETIIINEDINVRE
ncbi:hypothetical protein [Paenibacillus sp. GCM10028914]